jgi:broad specificity phosphatase PhoE/predicted kinase
MTHSNNEKLFVIMVGLPARGKSTIAQRLLENLRKDSINSKIFNNGDLRRKLCKENTSYSEFYDPRNEAGVVLREEYAFINMRRAKRFLENGGRVAILDATNVSRERRKKLESVLDSRRILYIECINSDEAILKDNIERKVSHSEFSSMSHGSAVESFSHRIAYYEEIYESLGPERNYIKLDSFHKRIIAEELVDPIPYYYRIRDLLVTPTIKNLYLIRHGETFFNLEDRIGGDSPLTEKGVRQAEALARYFQRKKIPLIFTSDLQRTIQTAEPIKSLQKNCTIIHLKEFSEINSGICEEMSYQEIRERMPEVSEARKQDKYNYVYPGGESYATMEPRIERGIKKAIYLSDNSDYIMIIGHRAVNRMILSYFVYRRKEDVPYIYIPQSKFYHIVINQNKKLFEMKKFLKQATLPSLGGQGSKRSRWAEVSLVID